MHTTVFLCGNKYLSIHLSIHEEFRVNRQTKIHSQQVWISLFCVLGKLLNIRLSKTLLLLLL